MALIVEDDTGLSNADSYISVADASAYVSSHKDDVTAWNASSTVSKEIAARVATQYLDGKYSYDATRLTETQSLQHPKSNLYDDNGILVVGVHKRIKDAQAEAMYLHINGEILAPNVSQADQVKREKVGDLEVEYKDNSSPQPTFTQISRILKPLLGSTNRIYRS